MKRAGVYVFIILFGFAQLVLMQTAVANAETLRMIIWEGYFPEKHRVKFKEVVKKKYGKGLKFQISFISDAQEFFSALRHKKVDIISPTHNLLKDERFNFIKKGLLIPIDLDNVPNSRYLMPGLKSVAYHTENGKMYAMPYANGPYGLAYNTGKIKKAPKSWKVLLDPKYSKKYTIVADYSEVNIYIAALAAGVNPDRLTSFRSVNTPRVNEILRRLRRNAGSFWNGVDKPSDLKGKTLATSWGFSFAELAKQGEIWKFAEPKEGSPWWVDNFSISWTLADKPELKRIAEELINYLISPEFQLDNVVGSLSAVPVNMKTPLTREQKRSYHMDDDAKTFVKRRILWPTLSKRTRNGFSKMWERAGE